MGNSCQKCTSEHTVYNLSDKLVKRITTGITEKVPRNVIPVNIDDLELFNKLKCIDNVHSKLYGLTDFDIENLMTKLENTLRKPKEACPNKRVFECYKRNSDCTLACQSEVEMFEECVDYLRLTKIKEFIRDVKKDQVEMRAKFVI